MAPQNQSLRSELQQTLQRIWGYADFRTPQGEIIETLLAQRDALIVMPTGGGKSLCFQLPALMRSGLTIVVSPLVALMEDQVQDLQQRQLPAGLLHSERSSAQRQQVLRQLEAQHLRLLYLSPETLFSAPVWQRLCTPMLQINGLIVDEAHCLTQWGETFRPTYYRLGAVRPALLQSKPAGSQFPIAAFTATADPATQQTIQQILQLQNPAVFRLNPYRANLSLQVRSVSTAYQRRQVLNRWIEAQGKDATGLVYVRTRRDSETLAAWLNQKGYKTAAYHAGLSSRDRRPREQAWLNQQVQFIVATCAFGMGVNKPDVRWVLHYQTPLLLSEYVQEVGRAGRDGAPATALMLKSSWLDSDDRQRWQFFQTQSQQHLQAAQKLATQIPAQGNVTEVCQRFPQAAFALAMLQIHDRLVWLDPFHYQIQSASMAVRPTFNTCLPMQQYLKHDRCRWSQLLQAFGFEPQTAAWNCGTCDVCTQSRFKFAR